MKVILNKRPHGVRIRYLRFYMKAEKYEMIRYERKDILIELI